MAQCFSKEKEWRHQDKEKTNPHGKAQAEVFLGHNEISEKGGYRQQKAEDKNQISNGSHDPGGKIHNTG